MRASLLAAAVTTTLIGARVATVQQENLQRLKDDIAILKKYLNTQDVPKGVISTLEGLSSKQQEIWRKAVEQIEELLEE